MKHCAALHTVLGISVAAALLMPVYGAAAGQKLTVSNYGRLATGLPWYIAIKTGLFKKAGIDVDEIVSGKGGGTTLRNMLASNSIVGEIATSAAVAAIRKNIPLVVIYSSSDNLGDMTWVSLPGKGMKSIKDLVGKRIGYTNPKSATEMTLRLSLEAAGIPISKVKVIPTGGLGGGLTLLRNGGIDAAVIVEPILSKAKGKFEPVFRAGAVVPKLTWGVGVTTRAFAKSHSDLIRKILAVRRRVVDSINSNPEGAAAHYAAYMKVDRALASKILKQFVAWKYLNAGGFDLKALDTAVRGLKMVGAIEGDIDWNKHVDQQFLPKDLQKKL